MEYNMADKKTDAPAEVTAEQTPQQEIIELANRSSRSMIAVIDAVCQRGGFKGEELTTIGQLRDQCISLVQLYESLQQQSS